MAADEAEKRRVQRPPERRRGIEQQEAPQRKSKRAGAESHCGASAGNEAADGDELPTTFPELRLSPVEAPPRHLTAEEALGDALAEAATDQVRAVVAEEGARGRREDDQGQTEVAGRGDDARRDDRRLARNDRQQCIEEREQEDDRVRPPRRMGNELGEVMKQAAILTNGNCIPLEGTLRSADGGTRVYLRSTIAQPLPAARAPISSKRRPPQGTVPRAHHSPFGRTLVHSQRSTGLADAFDSQSRIRDSRYEITPATNVPERTSVARAFTPGSRPTRSFAQISTGSV